MIHRQSLYSSQILVTNLFFFFLATLVTNQTNEFVNLCPHQRLVFWYLFNDKIDQNV